MPGGVVGDADENVGEVEPRVEAVELGGFDQRVHGGGTMTAGAGTGEKIILATDRHTAQGTLGRIVDPARAVAAAPDRFHGSCRTAVDDIAIAGRAGS